MGPSNALTRRWRWRAPQVHRMRFSYLAACNAIITFTCSLLLAVHFLWRPGPHVPRQSLPVSLHESTHTWTAATTTRIGNATDALALARPGFVALRNGLLMPQLGFGTAGLGQQTEQATSWALQAGYRLIDSAQATEWYDEKAVGRAIRHSNLQRDDLFLVSKLHPRHLGYEVTRQQFSSSLQDLGTSYLDLFLLHYPRCFSAICSNVTPAGTWQESWKALEDLHDELKVRAIGVSNFEKEELQELVASTRIKPFVIQRNSDPFNSDLEIQEYCQKEGIQYMGYSTLGSQWLMRGFSSNPVLNHPTIQSIAVAQSCTPAQVVLSWALQKRQVVVPRSSNQLRIAENLEAQRCSLTQTQVTQIDALDGHAPQWP